MGEDLRLPGYVVQSKWSRTWWGPSKEDIIKAIVQTCLRYAIESKSHLHMAVQLEISKQQKSVERHVSLALRKKGKKGVKT
jgi:hypothetical protein